MDPRWDSETDDLDDEIIRQPRPSAATNVTNNTVMGEFDEEPVRRKLVQVQSIPPPIVSTIQHSSEWKLKTTNVTNNTVMGEFDEEPVRRKPVQVQSIPPPRPVGAQGATSKVNDPVVSYAGTSLGKRKTLESSDELEPAEGSQTNLAPKKTESQ
ncbi:hypothetical protein RSAG8_11461, partial [Rhizoctonia solani AG-8 WAC10335]